jgi:hypothetical protein
MPQSTERTHHYNAEATLIDGHLQLPLQQQIGRQAHSALPAHGGYISQRLDNFRVGEVVSIRSGYTQVAGNRSSKANEGWSTLVTYVIEGLNVLEVLTADRVVGQIITEHPLIGYVPRISFLGSRFENLRIAGHPVKLHLDLGIIGGRPENDGSYGLSPALKERISSQYNRIREEKNLPTEMSDYCNQLSSSLGSRELVECSLVNHAAGDYPGSSFGHKIHVPDFGWITLGKVKILHEDFDKKTDVPKKTTVYLKMIDLELGCATSGPVTPGSGSSNGGASD